MRKYQKPIAEVISTTSEGVYASSGSSSEVGAHIGTPKVKSQADLNFICIWFPIEEDNYASDKIPHMRVVFDKPVGDVAVHTEDMPYLHGGVSVSGNGTNTITFNFSDRSIIGYDFNITVHAQSGSVAPSIISSTIY